MNFFFNEKICGVNWQFRVLLPEKFKKKLKIRADHFFVAIYNILEFKKNKKKNSGISAWSILRGMPDENFKNLFQIIYFPRVFIMIYYTELLFIWTTYYSMRHVFFNYVKLNKFLRKSSQHIFLSFPYFFSIIIIKTWIALDEFFKKIFITAILR